MAHGSATNIRGAAVTVGPYDYGPRTRPSSTSVGVYLVVTLHSSGSVMSYRGLGVLAPLKNIAANGDLSRGANESRFLWFNLSFTDRMWLARRHGSAQQCVRRRDVGR